MKKRAVITGIGVVSPIGVGAAENWQNLLSGASGIGRFSKINADHLPVSLGAEVTDFDPRRFIKDRKTIRLTFFNVHLALAAAQLAVEDAGIDFEACDPTRLGAIVGSGGGGFDDGPGVEDLSEPILQSWDEENQRFDSARFGEKGIPIAYPLFLLKALPNNAFYYISLKYNIQGENDNIVSSYTGGAQAVGDAMRAIRRGLSDIIIAGGYDSLITPNTIFGLDSFHLLSHSDSPADACRPFDRTRSGSVAGEGAGFLVIEEYEHARRRGAHIYAEVAGYGNSSSAYHLYNPDPDGSGIVRSARRSLEDAESPLESIDWTCADGLATPDADRAEARALSAVFGDLAGEVPVSAHKSLTGHTGSGAGAIESIYTALAISKGIIPPTYHCEQPDDDCRLNIITGEPVKKQLRAAMNITQGLGGQSTALVFKRVS